MKRIKRSQGLFSEARFQVLRVLYFAGAEGAGLREMAYRSELSIGAVQAAVKSLARLKLVSARTSGRRTIHTINEANPEYTLLSAVFERAAAENARRLAAADSKANRNLLSTLSGMQKVGRRARERVHGV